MFPIHVLVKGINDTGKPITTQTRKGIWRCSTPGNIFLWRAGGHEQKGVISPRAFIQMSSLLKTNLSLFLTNCMQMRYVGSRK